MKNKMKMTRRQTISAMAATTAAVAGLNSSSLSARMTETKTYATGLDCGPYSADIARFRETSDKGVTWLHDQLTADGSWNSGPIADLTGYTKVAYLFTITGQLEEANRLVSEIKTRFMQANGDFKISPTQKSGKVDYYEKSWAYANAWITFIAHKLGRFDVSYPAWGYLEKLYHPNSGGYTCNDPDGDGDTIIELLSTTHVGHTALYMGDLKRAENCGELVMKFERDQPEQEAGMYLRLDGDGNYLRQYPKADIAYYFLSATQPNQLYFMAGYPIAFLALLYRQTNKPAYLTSAIRYFDFSANCPGVYETHFSHKVAWGASILYNVTGQARFAEFAVKVAGLLLQMQHKSGAWFHDTPRSFSYDQTGECASWLRQISSEICDRRGL